MPQATRNSDKKGIRGFFRAAALTVGIGTLAALFSDDLLKNSDLHDLAYETSTRSELMMHGLESEGQIDGPFFDEMQRLNDIIFELYDGEFPVDFWNALSDKGFNVRFSTNGHQRADIALEITDHEAQLLVNPDYKTQMAIESGTKLLSHYQEMGHNGLYSQEKGSFFFTPAQPDIQPPKPSS